LIFFVNPDEEGLFLVVEDTSAVGPVAVQACNFQETIAFPKNKLVNLLVIFLPKAIGVFTYLKRK